MTATILDGKKLAAEIRGDIKQRVSLLKEKYGLDTQGIIKKVRELCGKGDQTLFRSGPADTCGCSCAYARPP